MDDDPELRDITQVFNRWRDGDDALAEELVPEVYGSLRRLAASYLRGERRGHTLQPTELVHEACARLLGSDVDARDQTHFFALAAQSMRRVLVDHARRARAQKRFDPAERVTLVTRIEAEPHREFDVLDLHDALERLAKVAPRPAQLVELRFFAGLTVPEIAEVLGISKATAARDWTTARMWLRRELQP